VQIRIEGRDLPGISCGPGPAFPGGHPNIHVGVQRRNKPGELVGLVGGDAESATWTLESTVQTASDGLDLKGPCIQGSPGARFVYLSWGVVDDDPSSFQMFRRAKLMLDAVPNLAFALGYTNASWTLKVDLVCAYLARLLRFMAENRYAVVTPRLPSGPMSTSPFIDMTSGYFERSRAALPRQGDRAPWRLRQHYFKDASLFRGPASRQDLEFRPAP